MRAPKRLGSAVGDVVAAGCCRHPVRLRTLAADAQTGELGERSVLVACKDRRAILCPACAQTYQADAFQLVAAGLRGGKGVPASVAEHPACFATLTAPGLGAVHARVVRDGHVATCRPRRDDAACPHGREGACFERHRADDPRIGRPLCPECFDYEGAVLWNASVSMLWQRAAVAAARALASAGGLSTRARARALRLSYIKVVEFQRRGLVHLHVVLRADGPTGPDDDPPRWVGADDLVAAVHSAAARVEVSVDAGTASGSVRWGPERTVRAIADDDRDAVASYLAKYAVKAATSEPALVRRPDPRRRPVLAGADPHVAALVSAAWRLGGTPALSALRLRAHAHTFGYGGHFATKSRRWSTTFQALRGARQSYAARAEPGFVAVDGTWRYSGRGYRSAEARQLAELVAEGIATRPRRIPGGPPASSPDDSGPVDQDDQ